MIKTYKECIRKKQKDYLICKIKKIYLINLMDKMPILSCKSQCILEQQMDHVTRVSSDHTKST